MRPTRGTHVVLALVLALSVGASSGCGGGGSSPTSPAAGTLWGAVGCSQTADAVEGYHLAGGEHSWPTSALESYGGGDLLEWGDPQSFRWSAFQAGVDSFGAGSVWFEICVRGRRSPVPAPRDLTAAEVVVQEIRRRAPGAQIFVSGMNRYEGITCGIAGAAGPDLAQAVADHLVDAGLASPGPVVGPLARSTTISDRCHANNEGKLLQGRQLLAFFG